MGPRSGSPETSTSPAATSEGRRGQRTVAVPGAQRQAPKSDAGGGTPTPRLGPRNVGGCACGAGRLLTRGVSCGCMTKHHSLCGLTAEMVPSVPRAEPAGRRSGAAHPAAAGPGGGWRPGGPGLWLHRPHPLGAPAQPTTLPGASVQPRTSVQDPSRVVPPQATSRSQGPQSVRRGRCPGRGHSAGKARRQAWGVEARAREQVGPPAPRCLWAVPGFLATYLPPARPRWRREALGPAARSWAADTSGCGQRPAGAQKGDTARGPEGLGSPRQVRPQPPRQPALG